ncbi:hypothetical protein F4823DRAFT_568462 [Ustulina deusta]|nr:hypothetical protein F4823DRAFT_568462 [Ustulina deusta]
MPRKGTNLTVILPGVGGTAAVANSTRPNISPNTRLLTYQPGQIVAGAWNNSLRSLTRRRHPLKWRTSFLFRPVSATPLTPTIPPPPEKPLRIQIDGPTVAVERLFPENLWNMIYSPKFPQPAAAHLAKLAHQAIYPEQHVSADNMIVRDEYLGGVVINKIPQPEFDYYGVTFDHLVPADDMDPEVLQINIIELETDEGPYAGGVEYANTYLNVKIDPADYVGKRILAVPRCCQKRKGTQDRG